MPSITLRSRSKDSVVGSELVGEVLVCFRLCLPAGLDHLDGEVELSGWKESWSI